MILDTSKIYICTDLTNGEVRVLIPKGCTIEIEELRLDEPDPSSPYANDRHEYALLAEEMNQLTFTLLSSRY